MIQVLSTDGEFHLGPFHDEAEAHAFAAAEGITGYSVEQVGEPRGEVEDSPIDD
ncbi:hypothetical protein [Achromobacter sp. AGC39]